MKCKVDLERVIIVLDDDECVGFCIVCGTEAEGVEGDAQRQVCEKCGRHQVYGAEMILSLWSE